MHKNSFYSNGKLLLSGEYLVMDGAVGLAVPLKHGQSLVVDENETGPRLDWVSKEYGQPWFNAVLELPALQVRSSSDPVVAEKLQQILRAANSMTPLFVGDGGFKVMTDLSFDRQWGFGSSSTLVSNIAFWFDVDPFELFQSVYQGSGYDIAVARSDRALLYSSYNAKSEVKKIDFRPPFMDAIYFVYLGKKQDTLYSIQQYRRSVRPSKETIDRVSGISMSLAKANDVKAFAMLLTEHESIMATIMEMPPVKDEYFPDFDGTVKSLGAWGGDFIMAVSEGPREKVLNYFNGKGLEVVFPFNDLVL